MTEQQESYQTYTQRQMPTYMDQSFMELRLSNKNVMLQVEDFLSGKRRGVTKNKDGTYKEVLFKKGSSHVNDKGLNDLLHLIALRTNPLIVQGNFTREEFYDYMEMTRKEIAYAVMVNLYDWGIDEDKYNYIIDNIMAFLIPFMSRLIDNKERDSYQNTFATKELINSQAHESRRFGLFK